MYALVSQSELTCAQIHRQTRPTWVTLPSTGADTTTMVMAAHLQPCSH